MHAGHTRYGGSDFFALLLEEFQVIAEDLEGEGAFGAGECLADVVFDRLREVPDGPRIPFYGAVHGGDEFLLAFVKYGAPLVMRLEVDEILRVAESPGIGSVVGPSDLGYNSLDLWKRREDISLVSGKSVAFREARAIRQSAPRPNGAFIQVREELRSNNAAKTHVDRSSQSGYGDTGHRPAMLHRPPQPETVLFR